uniref:Translocator protein n=1 Tax=Lygus hesperus TaxID=30085 RepID=A0A0A9YRI3_LYGHE
MVDCHYVIPLKMLPLYGYLCIREYTRVNLDWYLGIEHPPWDVTNTIFYVPAFSAAILASGCACFTVWTALEGSEERRFLMIPYVVQMVCLWADYPMLMGGQSLVGGLVNICVTTLLASVTGFTFWMVKPRAGHMMLPYLGFLLYEMCRDAWMYRKWWENYDAWHEAEENP